MKLASRVLTWGLAIAACLWVVGAIAFSPYATTTPRTVLALATFALATTALARYRKHGLRARLACLLACVAFATAWSLALRPSNDRAWAQDQTRLPEFSLDGNALTIRNVRNFHYRATDDYDARWETRHYDLAQLDSAWFVVEPFSGFAGAAHTFLSFGFANGEYLAVSVEIRKEAGESFSPAKGLYRNYEIAYVFGDERDLVRLRTEHRRDTVYVYPLRATPEAIRATLLDMVARAEALHREPEFYHSATNTCTTNLAVHANRTMPGAVPFSWHLLLPGYADERALALGLIDFDGTLAQARERFRVNERAAAAGDAPDFARRIRAFE